LGIEEPSAKPRTARVPGATLLHGMLFLQAAPGHGPRDAGLLDVSGRKIMDLRCGANDVSRLAPGIYFVKLSNTAPTRKVVIPD
jgi:hypothetical protein